MRRAPGDRRTRLRFEVFGAFWGTFDAGEVTCVHDLTAHGALIEAHQPLAVESVQSVRLVLDREPATCDARVRHVRLSPRNRYLIGLEFITPSSAFLEAVDRLMRFRAAPTQPA